MADKHSAKTALLGMRDIIHINTACKDNSNYFCKRIENRMQLINTTTGQILLGMEIGYPDPNNRLVLNISRLSSSVTVIGLRGENTKILRSDVGSLYRIVGNSGKLSGLPQTDVMSHTRYEYNCLEGYDSGMGGNSLVAERRGEYEAVYINFKGRQERVAQYCVIGSALIADIVTHGFEIAHDTTKDGIFLKERWLIDLCHNDIIARSYKGTYEELKRNIPKVMIYKRNGIILVTQATLTGGMDRDKPVYSAKVQELNSSLETVRNDWAKITIQPHMADCFALREREYSIDIQWVGKNGREMELYWLEQKRKNEEYAKRNNPANSTDGVL
jgi:hypothetical protein